MSRHHRFSKKSKEEKLKHRVSKWSKWLSDEILRQMSIRHFRGKRVGKGTRHKVLIRDGGCRCCGSGEYVTLHHIIPKRLKGTNHPDNLITLCEECHRDWNYLEAKGTYKWFQFFVWLERR